MEQNSEVRRGVIAVIDDDHRVLESLESLISALGFEPMLFSTAEAFIASGALADTACVITDLRMPGLGGTELHRWIRSHRPELRVIFISAHYDQEARRSAMRDGAVEFLPKPFDTAALIKSLDRAVGR